MDNRIPVMTRGTLRLATALAALALGVHGCAESGGDPYEGCHLPKYATWETIDNGQWNTTATVAPLSAVSLDATGNGFGLAASAQNAEASHLYRTLDAGASWTLVAQAESLSLMRLQFIGTDTAYATQEGALMKSTDGGASWQRMTAGSPYVTALFFLDASNGWLADTDGRIRRTSNGGKDWKTLYDDGVEGGPWTFFHRIYFADASEGRLMGHRDNVAFFLLTHDGGKKWTEVPMGGTLGGMHFLDKNLGWVCGSGGRIARTTDGGATWEGAGVGASTLVNDVRFVTPTTGYAVGDGGYLGKSTDGGATWVRLNSGLQKYFSSLQVQDADRVWVTEWQNGPLRTTDGGATWARAAGFPTVTDVFFPSPGTGWVAGPGFLSRTTDGGATWANVLRGISPATSLCFSGQSGWLVGGGGLVQRTTDAGATWQTQASGTSNHLRTAACLDANTAVAAGDGGTVIRTIDGGASWTSQTLPEGRVVRRLRFIGSIGWAAGNGGTLFKTTDAGISWNPQQSGTGRDLVSIEVLDANHAYVAEEGDKLLKTTDGGATWSSSSPDPRFTLTAVAFLNAQTGFAAGSAFAERVFDSPAAAQRMARAGFGGGALDQFLPGKPGDPEELRLAGIFHGPDCPSDTGGTLYQAIFKTTDAGETWAPEYLQPGYSTAYPWFSIECRTSGRCLAFSHQILANP